MKKVSIILFATIFFILLTSIYSVNASSFDFVNSMKLGWNLGNSLDSTDYKKQGINTPLINTTPEILYETLWGNPVTTEEIINTVADAGFGSVRVPITYYDHMDDEYNITETWLARVKTIVDYVINNNMYCIINLHHDAGIGTWLKADWDSIDEMKRRLNIVWTQIAEYFIDYDEHLVFEGFNEILDADGNWSKANNGAYEAVNILNQTFVDAVRSTGSNNAVRYLVLKTYASGTDQDMFESFVIPNDSAEDKLIIGVHSYVLVPFHTLGYDYVTGSAVNENKTFYTVLDNLKKNFIDKGVPVIITEFGTRNKNNTEDREAYAETYVGTAKQYGITCFWWDNGGKVTDTESVSSFALLDRYNNEWIFPTIVQSLVNAAVKPETEAKETHEQVNVDNPRWSLIAVSIIIPVFIIVFIIIARPRRFKV